MNARKGAAADVLDPFDVKEDWFALELVDFQVLPGDGLADEVTGAVANTIECLRLNDPACCEARAEYAEYYWSGDIVPEHGTNGRLRLIAQKVEERRHRVTDRGGTRRHVHRTLDVDGGVAVSGEVGRARKTRGHARGEHLPVPDPVVFFGDRSGVPAFGHSADAAAHG